MPEKFAGSGLAAVPDRWWTAFGESSLNEVERRALAGNFSLESAWQRLRQARAVVNQVRSDEFVDVDAFLSGSATAGSIGREGGSFQRDITIEAGLAASYEVDLWGGIRSRTQAAQLRAQATRQDYETAALSLVAEVATAWFQLTEAQAQLDLLDEQIEVNGKVAQLLEARFGEGQGRAVDVLRQRQLQEATREQRVVVETAVGVLQNRLTVLQGGKAGGRGWNAGRTLPALPAQPATGLPLQLLQRRPDVRAAFLRVKAADASLAAAITEQFPRLNLTANLSGGGGSGGLFRDWASGIAAELVSPLLDGGERAAEVERSRGLRAEALADFRQTTMEAIEEVENALLRESKQQQRITKLARQLSLAERSSGQLRREFLNGVGSYIDVLTSLTAEQQLRRDLLTARRNLLEFRVALYRSLAGGFTAGSKGGFD